MNPLILSWIIPGVGASVLFAPGVKVSKYRVYNLTQYRVVKDFTTFTVSSRPVPAVVAVRPLAVVESAQRFNVTAQIGGTGASAKSGYSITATARRLGVSNNRTYLVRR